MTEKRRISMDELIARVKSHPDIHRAGMILCHNGIVRAYDRPGSRGVRGLKASFDPAKIEEIRQWARERPGIVTVEIEPLDGEFEVGDDLLYVAIAGDIRENVLGSMAETLDRLKAEAVVKIEDLEESLDG